MQNLDLSVFEGLQHNWDGDDAIAPELETIENFRGIVNQLNWPPFDIYASPNGYMDIESASQIGTTFHLQVGVSRWKMYVRIDGGDKIVFHTEGSFDSAEFPYSNVQIALDTLQ